MTDRDHRSLDWAADIIGMCEPIRCYQGGMWFNRNHNFADATFVDYGAADAFAVAAKAFPGMLAALRDARAAIAALSMDSLGFASAENGEQIHWPIRDELLHRIDTVLGDVGSAK